MTDRMEFSTTLVLTERGHARAPLPFDPRQTWGRRPRHYVEGTVAGLPFSGSVGFAGGAAFLVLSSDFRHRASVTAGDRVEVQVEPVARDGG